MISRQTLEWRGKTGMNDRLLRKTVATTLILLLVLPTLGLIAPVMAQLPRIVSITPTIGPPNTTVEVSLDNLTVGTTYRLYLDMDGDGLVDDPGDSLLLTLTAEATSETKTVTIPVGTLAGIHAIMLTDSPPPISNEAPDSLANFMVTAVSVTLTPNIGPPDTVVHVTGSGFTPGRRYQIYFDPSGR
jgi:hypothetical protein